MQPDNDPLQQASLAKLSAEAVLGAMLDVPVLLPGTLDRAAQHSDARDVAAWVVAMLAQGRGGTFDTVGPGRGDSLGEVLEASVGAAGNAPGDVQLVKVDEDVLRPRLGALPEQGRTLRFPGEQIPHDAIDTTAAIAAGLTSGPARDTAAAR